MRILTLFARYGNAIYPEAEKNLAALLEDRFPNTAKEYIWIDSKLPPEFAQTISPHVTLLGSDNTHWEFGAWSRGLERARTSIHGYDFVFLVTSAFQRFYTAYLERLSETFLRILRTRQAAAGHLEAYNTPVTFMGVRFQSWLRSSFIILPSSVAAMLGSTVSLPDATRFFSGNPEAPFREDAPLCEQYKRNIISWLTGEGTGQGVIWHSRFTLTQETMAYFGEKARAILNEMALSNRLRALGCALVDATWLDSVMLKSQVPGIFPSWKEQVASRDFAALSLPDCGEDRRLDRYARLNERWPAETLLPFTIGMHQLWLIDATLRNVFDLQKREGQLLYAAWLLANAPDYPGLDLNRHRERYPEFAEAAYATINPNGIPLPAALYAVYLTRSDLARLDLQAVPGGTNLWSSLLQENHPVFQRCPALLERLAEDVPEAGLPLGLYAVWLNREDLRVAFPNLAEPAARAALWGNLLVSEDGIFQCCPALLERLAEDVPEAGLPLGLYAVWLNREDLRAAFPDLAEPAARAALWGNLLASGDGIFQRCPALLERLAEDVPEACLPLGLYAVWLYREDLRAAFPDLAEPAALATLWGNLLASEDGIFQHCPALLERLAEDVPEAGLPLGLYAVWRNREDLRAAFP
ncbi:MAG: hypothetical protein LBM00_09690, partial [Deltaproteobacteria bacterium]|nr:hypothetical protein [Deltaproteobacteria bacterium]